MTGKQLKEIVDQIPDEAVLRFVFAEQHNCIASVDIEKISLSDDGRKLFFSPSEIQLEHSTAQLPPNFFATQN